MALQGYTSPGVQVIETINSAQAPLVSNPSVIGLVGAAQGYQSATERDLLTSGTTVTLGQTGINLSTVSVVSSYTNNVLNAGTYYLVTTGTGGAAVTTIAITPAPTTSPSFSTGTGNLTGTYVYAVSYINSLGETGVGPVSSSITVTSTGINLASIPVDSSTGNATTGRNIYRAKVVGGVQGPLTLVATIANNTATTLSNENTSDATAANNPVPKEGITSGETVLVSYQYTNTSYFLPNEFTDYPSIVNMYGPAFNSSGQISSQLTLAAQIAFQNGASDIVCVAAVSSSDSNILNALDSLVTATNVSLVGCVSGDASVASGLAAYLTSQNTSGYWTQGVAGYDGSVTPVSQSTLQTAAQTYNYEAFSLVSPATFILQNPVTGTNINVGGQYMAAAILGMAAARDVEIPLTRKTVAGFSGIYDYRTPAQQALDSQAGLMVIRQPTPNGPLQVRQSLTTAVSNTNTSEFSVIRAKYYMANSLEQALNNSIIGQVIDVTNITTLVNGVVSSVLEQLVLEGAIDLYGYVTSQVSPTSATTVNVSFSYYPAFPVNNIVVSFSIDTNSGDFTSNIGVA